MVFPLGGNHFKVAASPGGRRGLLRERQGAALAAADAFWAPYVEEARFCGGLLKQAPLCNAAADGALSVLLSAIGRRIEALPSEPTGWPQRFRRIEWLADAKDQWPARLEAIFANEPCASCHGDLCRANCLDGGSGPVLIDWGNFRPEFWAPYDACHSILVDLAADTGLPWLDCVKHQVNTDAWDRFRALRYLVCRVELEADQDIAIGRLDSRRRKKYLDALSWAQTQMGA
jgi:hypothetical protein